MIYVIVLRERELEVMAREADKAERRAVASSTDWKVAKIIEASDELKGFKGGDMVDGWWCNNRLNDTKIRG